MNPQNISANFIEALSQALRKKQMKKHLGIEDQQPMEEEKSDGEGALDPETLEMLQQVAQMPMEEGGVEVKSVKVMPEEEEED